MIAEAYKRIQEQILEACQKSGRNPSDIQVVGVTKTVDESRILASIDVGIRHVGENRVQEYLEKYDLFRENKLTTSIIGKLQTNKVKYIADKVDLIQSLDSVKLATEIQRQAKKCNRVLPCLVEVNIGGESSKAGISVEEVLKLIEETTQFPNIHIKGLMAIPPIMTNEKVQRGYFEKLYQLFIDIRGKKLDNVDMELLSMGMSGDFYPAILEGANMVRIGSALYGKR